MGVFIIAAHRAPLCLGVRDPGIRRNCVASRVVYSSVVKPNNLILSLISTTDEACCRFEDLRRFEAVPLLAQV
jgi:hypothetical protein